jgi:hypothetical protein
MFETYPLLKWLWYFFWVIIFIAIAIAFGFTSSGFEFSARTLAAIALPTGWVLSWTLSICTLKSRVS